MAKDSTYYRRYQDEQDERQERERIEKEVARPEPEKKLCPYCRGYIGTIMCKPCGGSGKIIK